LYLRGTSKEEIRIGKENRREQSRKESRPKIGEKKHQKSPSVWYWWYAGKKRVVQIDCQEDDCDRKTK